MEEDHYLVSATINRAVDLQYKDGRRPNPFCVLEAVGSKKCTEYRLSTCNPVWEERLDIVLASKPTSVSIVCKSYEGERLHKEVGRAVIDLDSLIHNGREKLKVPLNNMDIGGVVEGKGHLEMSLNFKKIPYKRRHHYSWTDIIHLDIINVKGLPLYATCLEKNMDLNLVIRFNVQQFSCILKDSPENHLNSAGFMFVDSGTMKDRNVEFFLGLRKGENEHIIGEGQVNFRDILAQQKTLPTHSVTLTEIGGETTKLKNFEKRIGRVVFKSQLISRNEVEKRLVEDLFDEYDYDFDGRLNKEEVFDMLTTILPKDDLENIAERIDSLQTDRSKFIKKCELLKFLRSSELNAFPFVNLLIISSLKGRCFPSTAHLLRGFSYPQLAESPTFEVYDRYSGKCINERIPVFNL